MNYYIAYISRIGSDVFFFSSKNSFLAFSLICDKSLADKFDSKESAEKALLKALTEAKEQLNIYLVNLDRLAIISEDELLILSIIK